MGNTASTSGTNKSVFTPFKSQEMMINRIDNDICDKKGSDNVIYVASTEGHNQSSESIIFGSTHGDRRERIVKCLGRVESYYGDKDKKSGNPIVGCGTGTVFCVKDGMVDIITCAHNVVDVKKDPPKHPLSVRFAREVSKFEELHRYDVMLRLSRFTKIIWREEIKMEHGQHINLTI